MQRTSPRHRASGLERRTHPLSGTGERFDGYGVLGLPFTLGHVLAFRRVPTSSIGPAYTAVWHRDPDGLWTIFTDVSPALACPRYFAIGRTRAIRTEIRLEWTGSHRAAISIPEHQLSWAIRIETSPATRTLDTLSALLPHRLLGAPGLLNTLGPLAGRLLDAGPLRFTGRTPAGPRFALLPRRISLITAAAAVVGGRDLGPLGPIGPREGAVRLGDLRMPDRGLFVLGQWRFDPAPDGHP